MTPDEIYAVNAKEARIRDLRTQIARINGQISASTVLASSLSRVNQDSTMQKQELETELRKLEDSGSVASDDWGKFSSVEKAAFDERYAGKVYMLQWLQSHKSASFEQVVSEFETKMLEFRASPIINDEGLQVRSGRPWLIQRGDGLIREWITNALDKKLIPSDSWEAFRDFILAITFEEAMGLSG